MKQEKPKLVVLGGPMDGAEFDVDKPELSIGRLDDNDVCLPLDPTVSRHHARLMLKADAYWLEDVGSTYGTFVESSQERITTQVKIQTGTIFRLGSYAFLKLIMVDVEQRLVERANRLMRRLRHHLPNVQQDKWAGLKEQIVSLLRRLEMVQSKEELYNLLQDMATAIEEALGIKILFGPQIPSGPSENQNLDLPNVMEGQPPPVEALESLKSFFKSNLDEIVEKMESQQFGEAKP